MVSSMTGYGKAELELSDLRVTVQVKSLNSKHLDLRTKISSRLNPRELEIRKLISQELHRGKIDLSIDVVKSQTTEKSSLDLDKVDGYIEMFKALQVKHEVDNVDLLNAVMRLPDIYNLDQDELTVEEWSEIRKALITAIDGLKHHRSEEGISLRDDLLENLRTIETISSNIDVMDENRLLAIRKKMEGLMDKHLQKQNVDEHRLEQEILFYLEKLDINEEKVRLKQHCIYFQKVLEDNTLKTKGKQLNFISQEIGREINTLGAKAYDAEIQKLVIEMKNALEKIKEQTANVL